MPDAVHDAFERLQRRDPAAVAAFQEAAAAVLLRFNELKGDAAAIAESAIARTLKAPAEFKSIVDAARKQTLREAAKETRVRAFAALRATGDAAPADKLFYASLSEQPEITRRIIAEIFVKRVQFADFAQSSGLNGPQLSAVLTTVRQMVEPGAQLPPPNDTPAYVRVPFLVTGKLSPEDGLRVREHLGQSVACRSAYRELDLLDRRIARLGAACAEDHPDPESLVALADGAKFAADRSDSLAEHLRICAGCDAFVNALRATAAVRAPRSVREQMDRPEQRRQVAILAMVASVVIPFATHEVSRGNARWVAAGKEAGVDLGVPLRDEPDRAPAKIVLPGAGAAPVSIVLPIEADVAFDVRLTRPDGTELDALGGVPFERVDRQFGRIPLRLLSERFVPGEYQLHVYRRFIGLGGQPLDLVFPLKVEK